MVGKWHLCPTDEMNLASTRRNWPSGRGFERWYGFLGAETNQWYPDLVYDNHPVDQPRSPEEGYHLSEDLADRAIGYIADLRAYSSDKPFLLYLALGACNAPHHVPPAYRDRYQHTKARIGKQRGAKVAQVDLARRLAEAIWHMLSRGEAFAPKGATDPLAA
jgi:arylsulfatase